ncbi:hypothetical protein QQF64_033634 [Cirrhinus molitorella]|uniref:Uncharacterized protein n=1 Tax=Cirrhinus molitorella TaxID=172907 RepID=A0ABR3MUD9_9TELE
MRGDVNYSQEVVTELPGLVLCSCWRSLCFKKQSWVGIMDMGMASCQCQTTKCGNGKEHRWKQPSRGSLEEDSGTPGLGTRRGDIQAALVSLLPFQMSFSVDLRQDSQRL